MAKFGGNEFIDFSVPLIFEGRYFIMEPGNPPKITVVLEIKGQPVFEVLKNESSNNPFTEVTKTPPGIVTISERESGKFLYKIRPGSETSIAFGKIDGGEISAIISDNKIQIGGIILRNNTFGGNMAGVVVRPDGSVGIAPHIPPQVLSWLTS
jgi:hypothetical protein